MTDTPNLFGLPDDEWLQNDLATVYENWECDVDPEHRTPFVIVEWSAKPIGEFVQSADHIIERLYDWLADDDVALDRNTESIDRAFADPGVLIAFEAARAVLVRRLNMTGWRNADREVKRHHITWDEAGQPLVDGEPLYIKSCSSD